MVSSDQFEVIICTECGMIGYFHQGLRRPICPLHKHGDSCVTLKLPYACKLLFQELQSMNILPKAPPPAGPAPPCPTWPCPAAAGLRVPQPPYVHARAGCRCRRHPPNNAPLALVRCPWFLRHCL